VFDLEVTEQGRDAAVQGWGEGLRVALDNLLRNAATHGRPPEGAGTGAPAVRVEVVSTADRVTVHVDDNGPGIPAVDRERVLDRFARGTTAVSGSGLGLALAAQQAALHGGDIAIADAPAGGARVTLWLPARPAVASD
jgi:signal transduction histidine kinase